MADKELVEGLRTALSRGESLEQAMYTFFNAGYEKAKIEEAARALVYQREPEPMPQRPVSPQPRLKPRPKPIVKPSPMPLFPQEIKPQLEPQPIPSVSKPIPPPKPSLEKPLPEPYIPPTSKETTKKPLKQIVSEYEKQKPPKKKLAVILLIIFLIILFGGLASVFIFRAELIEIFNNLIESL